MRVDGSVHAWGRNVDRELGFESKTAQETTTTIEHDPVLISPFETSGIVDVQCGEKYTLALDDYGRVFSFGTGLQGQLGRNHAIERQSKPEMLGGLLGERKVTQIAAGSLSAAAISEEGELFEWGLIHYDPPQEKSESVSLEMHGLAEAERVEPGQESTLTRRRRNNFYSERLRKLVEESTVKYLTSTTKDQEARASDTVQVAEASGSDDGGQQQFQHDGNGEAKGEEGVVNLRTRRKVVPSPQLCKSLEHVFVSRVSLGAAHVAVLSKDGFMFTKGYNDRGQLGLGDRVSRANFHRVYVEGKNVKFADVVCGSAHNIALSEDGEMFVFGTNAFGQLGCGAGKGEQLQPILVPFSECVIQVAAGDHHSVCLTKDGCVYSWGHAEYGQQGGRSGQQGDLQVYAHLMRYYHEPRPVFPFFREQGNEEEFVQIKYISSAARYSVGIDIHGAVWTWGWNGFSVLGHGPGARGGHPQIIERLAGESVTRISAGPSHVMIIVPQIGSRFALSYAPLLLNGDETQNYNNSNSNSTTFDLVLKTKKDGFEKQSIEYAHKFVVFARCPSLCNYFNGKDEINLPFTLPPRILRTFVEYLYLDDIKSCPPHRLIDIQKLGERFNLNHLVSIAKYLRYQRALKLKLTHSTTTDAVPTPLRSTFVEDMKKVVPLTFYHDIEFETAEDDFGEEEEEEEEERERLVVPIGHTSFSWNTNENKRKLVSTANRAVLKRYPFFEKLLTGSFKEATTDKPILLHNLTPKGLDLLIHWMYSGDRSLIQPDTVMSVLATAKCFGIEDLADACEDYLYTKTNETNAQIIHEFAQDNLNQKLLRKASKYLQQ